MAGRPSRLSPTDSPMLPRGHAPTPIEGAIAVRSLALGEAATQLPWLCPCASSLLALACQPAAAAWQEVRDDPDQAWVAGFLAPLGWLAICAVNPAEAAACLADPAFRQDPVGTQQKRWGYDQAAIARRLARRWRLPDGLAVVIGHLGLPGEIALTMGANPDLLHLIQLAVGLVQQGGRGLRLTVGADLAINASALG